MARKLSEVGKATPVQARVTLCLDGNAAARFDALVKQANAAINRGDHDRALTLAGEIEDLSAKLETVECVFQQLPDPDEFDRLIDECPPSEQQRERGDKFDTAQLRPKLVRAAMVNPEPDETFDDWWKSLSWGQRDRLYSAALDANTETIDVPFVRAASESIRILIGTSATAGREASRSRSSVGGASGKKRRTSTTRKAASPGK